MESLAGEGTLGDEKQQVNEELLLKQITDLVINQRLLSGKANVEDRVVNFIHPEELKELVDLSLGGSALNHVQILELCKQAVEYSVKTNHPKFLNQLYHACDPVGLAGAWLTEALNTNLHTFEVAPFFLMVECAVLAHLRGFIGWEDGDGIFAPGGSISNMYGIVLDRYKKFPEVKTKGVGSIGELVAFTSEESHYSLAKAAHWIGLGTDNLIIVASDSSGKMIPAELEIKIVKALEQKKIPFFINATAGTTVLGAYDPLEPLALVCKKYDVWLHVDAAWGGGALVSQKYRFLMDGIQLADSVTWNLHKILGAPLQCSAFLTKLKDKDILNRCNSASATCLFQTDKFYDVRYDIGDKSVQCGRKVDAFKLWLMWKARGDRGLEEMVDNSFECAEYFSRQIAQRSEFRLVLSEPNCTNVCFWYIPHQLRNCQESPEWWEQISKVAPAIKKRMVEKGSLMIGYQPLPHKNLVNFFRLVIPCQPRPTHEDMDFVIDEIERLGCDL
ncbi:cysteine sulfinic acid decarboxylase-like [Daphnia pulicaria]|uniref:cysteine sulfinic acid decarboxylase-like n=1 Tax=Daphnia pulicaria TaxID=35523 RepID=UPI001EE9F236|nr:cysteine sulfinic acid decarboxylase-like [Daphnia pulicaria]